MSESAFSNEDGKTAHEIWEARPEWASRMVVIADGGIAFICKETEDGTLRVRSKFGPQFAWINVNRTFKPLGYEFVE